MDTKKKDYFEIIGGPNKDLLFDACKYAYDKLSNIAIDFTVISGYTTSPDDPACAYVVMNVSDFKIAGIEHENGSGESFNIHGYCKLNQDTQGILACSCRFKAYYNARSRKGTISFP